MQFGGHQHQFDGFRRQFVCLRRPFMTARRAGLSPGVPSFATASTPVAKPDAARRGPGAHARVPSRALRDEQARRQRRACPRPCATLQRRPPSRELERGRLLARDRGVFLWAGPAWDAARLGRLSRRPRRAPAANPARLGFRGALACVARYGEDGARHAAQRSSLKGAAPACRLWLLWPAGQVGPRASRPSRAVQGGGEREWLRWHGARRVPRLFAPGLRKVAR
jgi:hypothetical protein